MEQELQAKVLLVVQMLTIEVHIIQVVVAAEPVQQVQMDRPEH